MVSGFLTQTPTVLSLCLRSILLVIAVRDLYVHLGKGL
jgi:hypothetical protein